MLVGWGIKKADELNLEPYIDATEEGVPLYGACGYIEADKVDLQARKPPTSEEWAGLIERMLPFSFWPMWRPAGGNCEKRKTTQPS